MIAFLKSLEEYSIQSTLVSIPVILMVISVNLIVERILPKGFKFKKFNVKAFWVTFTLSFLTTSIYMLSIIEQSLAMSFRKWLFSYLVALGFYDMVVRYIMKIFDKKIHNDKQQSENQTESD